MAKRTRLAYCCPLPPTPSGIADYAAEQIPELKRCFDEMVLFCPGKPTISEPGGCRALNQRCLSGVVWPLFRRILDPYHQYEPANPPKNDLKRPSEIHPRSMPYTLLAGLPVQPLIRLPMEGPWDAIVYHIGNHFPFHGEIYDMALRVPGVVILHEYGIQHLVRDKGRPESFMEEMRYAYGTLGEAVAQRFVESGITAEVGDYPLFERLTDSSRGLIVHNESARGRVLASRPKAQVRVVPHPHFQQFSGGKTISRNPARTLFGLPPEALVFGSFGFATPAKRLSVVLSAFKRLRQKIPTAHFLLVGDLASDPGLQELLNKERLDGVEATGAVPMDVFISAMRAVDIAVNLRHPPGGETSGSALRLMGLGTPLIVSDSGSLAEIPDHCCVKITTGFNEENELLAAMLTLAGNEILRRQMGENVQRHTEAHHAPRSSAESFASAIRDLSAFEPQTPWRNQVSRRPAPEARLEDTFLGGIGAALHEVGVEEDDTEVVNHIADLAKGLKAL